MPPQCMRLSPGVRRLLGPDFPGNLSAKYLLPEYAELAAEGWLPDGGRWC